MMRTLRAAFAALIIAAVVCGGAVASLTPLVNFQQEQDRARLTPRGGVRHDGDGGRYVFQQWKRGMDEWPALVLPLRDGLPADWSGHDALVLTVNNPGARPVDIALHLGDGDGASENRHFLLQPGPNAVELPLYGTRYLNPARIREVHVYLTRPVENTPLDLGTLFLAERLEDRLRDASARLDALRRAADRDGFPRLLDGVTRNAGALRARLAGGEDGDPLRRAVEAFETHVRQNAPRLLSEARMRRAWAAIAPAAPYALGFASSMQKVFPKDLPFEAEVAREGRIELAGNETEAIQLLILAGDEGLDDVRVEVGPLTRAIGGETLSAAAAPVGFVETQRPPYRADYVGWHPDPILDFLESFDVKAGEMQPLWLSVKTPAGAAPGEYRGTVTVRPANAPARTLGLRVTVWGFDVPAETHLRTALSYREGTVKQVYGELTPEMNRRYEDFLLAHRLNPDNIYRFDPPAVEDVTRWAKAGMNAFNITYVMKPKDLEPDAPYPPEAKAKILALLDRVIPAYKAAGVYDRAYVYGFDEVRPDSHNAMRDVLGAIREKYPDLTILTTAYDATYGEASKIDAVDAWTPLTDKYDLPRAERTRAQGKEVWWYICIVPKAPYANVLIEYPAIDARMLMGLQTAKYRPDGFLYYALNRWPLSKKPITDGPYTDWPTRSFGEANGDGSVLCAGPNGPLSTIRLENLTDGIEDNEYFWLLRREKERLKDAPGADAAKARRRVDAALSIGDDLVRGLKDFSKSPDAVYAKRRQAAEAILAARGVATH